MLEAVQTGRTKNEKMIAVYNANAINKACGGVIIAPWQLQELPDEWMDAFTAMSQDLPEMQTGQAQVEAIKEKWRKEQRYV